MRPLFIVGVSRSGTTYLHHLLNTHPQIRLSYEGRLFTEGWDTYEHNNGLKDRSQFNSLIESLIKLDKDEKLNHWIANSVNQCKGPLYENHNKSKSFTSLIENIYQCPGMVQCWGNKMLRIEMAKSILEHWPDSKFVVLVRDPKAVYASQKFFFPHRRLKYSAIYWNLHSEILRQQVIPQNQCMSIKYEDFVTQPEYNLGRILEFSGLDNDDEVKNMLSVLPASSASLEKWKYVLNEKEIKTIESICFDTMKIHGYEPTVATENVKLSAFTKIFETILDSKHRIPLNPTVWRRKKVLQRFLLIIK